MNYSVIDWPISPLKMVAAYSVSNFGIRIQDVQLKSGPYLNP